MRRMRHAPSARGFTLVELMVAMVAGLFVSMAVFTLAKHASAFATQQARIADATLQGVVGFERLKADIARAGFLSSPNATRDPNICRSVDADYPLRLARLASVAIDTPAARSVEQSVNGITPRAITLAGSYDSADLFVARHIEAGIVYLSPTGLGMANIGYSAAASEADNAAALGRVFQDGRALRIVDDAGGVQFATIGGVVGGPNPAVLLEDDPAVQFRGSGGLNCGVRGLGNDFVNVINIIRYELRDVGTTDEAFRGDPSYGQNRAELVREELDVLGNRLGTTELLAEYAVDLGFSLLVAPSVAGNGLQRKDGDELKDYAGLPAEWAPASGPQLIRAVRAWLSVRSQEADRTTGLSLETSTPGPTQLRISLHPTNPALPPFARVRTLQATIPLTNQARVTWQ